MAWLYLLLACVCEITWSGIGLKLAGGGSNLKLVAITFICNAAALFFVMLATKSLPVSIAYPVLVGTGIAGSTLIGICFFHEPGNLLKILCITLIFVGVIGLKITEKTS